MITTFFQDIRLKCDENGNYYANGSLSNSVIERYLKYTNRFIIVSRKEKIDSNEGKKYDLLKNTKLEFLSINKLSLSMFIGKDFKSIKEIIKKSNRIIVRMPSFIGIPAIIEARRQKKKCLIEMVGCPFDALWFHGNPIFKIFAIPTMIVNKLLIKNNEYVTYVSNIFLQNRYPCKNKSYAIADVDVNISTDYLKDRKEKIRRFSKEKTIVLGTIASSLNVKYKGQQYVLKAMSLLNKKGYNFEYRIVGSGNKNYLTKIAQKYNVLDQVKFVGSFPHNEVESFNKSLDIYIQPSNAESFGRVIIEAMNTGCPVIGSSAGGIPENVNKKFIFKKRNYKDLADKLELMINYNLDEVAKENFKIASKYTNEKLEKQRNLMFNEFYCEEK